MTAKLWHIEEGKPYPMGATLTSKGANFTLFSINAEKVELCLFDKDKETPFGDAFAARFGILRICAGC